MIPSNICIKYELDLSSDNQDIKTSCCHGNHVPLATSHRINLYYAKGICIKFEVDIRPNSQVMRYRLVAMATKIP